MEKKNYSMVLMIFAIATLMMPIAETFAQGGRGGRGGRRWGDPRSVSAANLMGRAEVREELEITEEQMAAIKTAMEELRGEREPADRPNVRDMNEEERAEFRKKMQSEQEARAKKAKEKLTAILLPHQMERLEQIAMQVRGVGALRSEEVAAQLGLTKEQTTAIRKSIEEAAQGMQKQMRELFQGDNGGDMQAVREKMQELRQEIEEKAMAHLSEDQQKKFEELKGEKFEMPQQAFFRGGRRGGRGERERGRRGSDRPERPQRPEVE